MTTHRQQQEGYESTSPFPWELQGVVALVPSPSGKYIAIVRETDDAKTKENLNNKSFAYIEVSFLICSINAKSKTLTTFIAG